MSAATQTKRTPPPLLALIRVLDNYLAAYDAFCDLKQVVLVGRVSRGNSIRKVLVKEAKLCHAMKVVVGVNKHCSLGGSASLAKFCTKKLPPTTAVIAIHGGKIIFERVAATSSQVGPKPIPQGPSFTNGSVVQWVMNLPNRSLSFTKLQLDLTEELKTILRNNNSTCRWFQYEELCSSANQLCSGNVIGKGGSSQVYRGCLPNGKNAKNPFPWDLRFKVAIGVAEALSYLHDGCSKPVIHRDVKSYYILLTHDFSPQVMDNTEKQNVRQVLKRLIVEDGWKGFYRGLGPRFFSMSAWGTTMVVAYEYLKRLCAINDEI